MLTNEKCGGVVSKVPKNESKTIGFGWISVQEIRAEVHIAASFIEENVFLKGIGEEEKAFAARFLQANEEVAPVG